MFGTPGTSRSVAQQDRVPAFYYHRKNAVAGGKLQVQLLPLRRSPRGKRKVFGYLSLFVLEAPP